MNEQELTRAWELLMVAIIKGDDDIEGLRDEIERAWCELEERGDHATFDPLWGVRIGRARARGRLWAQRALEDRIARWVSHPGEHELVSQRLSGTSDPDRSWLKELIHAHLVPSLRQMCVRCAFAYDREFSPVYEAAQVALRDALRQGSYDERVYSFREFLYQHVLADTLTDASTRPTFKTVYNACLLELDESSPVDVQVWIRAMESHEQVEDAELEALNRVQRHLLDRTMGALCASRYELDAQPFAQGGMAALHRAHDWVLRRGVALKLIKEEGALDTTLLSGLFLDEILALASVSHPNVVTVLDAGYVEHDGERRAYLAMPLLEGEDLGEHRGERRHARDVVISYMLQAIRGVAALHEAGLVHRDIKPSNLFVSGATARDHVWVMDFGLAIDPRRVERDANAPIQGTPKYLPYEYLDCRTVSPRLDVYQLGMVFVELLTGRPLVPPRFKGHSLLFFVASQQVRLPDELASDPLAGFLRRAMAFDERERFSNAGEMLGALMIELEETTR